MYFNSFPLTKYTINGKTENVLDIFKRVAILKEKTPAYFDLLVTDNDTIETLAEEYYGDANLSWIIALTNDIIDPISEFPMSTMTLTNLYNTKYSGDIIYSERNLNLQEGDILVKASSGSLNKTPEEIISSDIDTTKYCFVSEYNNEFRYAKIINANFTVDTSTYFIAFRKINTTLSIVPFLSSSASDGPINTRATFSIIRKDKYLNSPLYFYNSLDNKIISPYQKWELSAGKFFIINDYVNIESNGAYDDINDDNAFRRSILYRFMNNLTVQDLSVNTLKQNIETKNEKFRVIKMLPIDVIPKFLDTFTELMTKRDTRSRIISVKE
jgi:hypothetical protein